METIVATLRFQLAYNTDDNIYTLFDGDDIVGHFETRMAAREYVGKIVGEAMLMAVDVSYES